MIFKYLSVFLVVIIIQTEAAPQRSPYAPRPVQYPEVLPQYTSTVNNELDNRFGAATSTQAPYPSYQTDSGSLYPVDDLDWINKEWPKDKIPFNVVNSQHLQAHRGRPCPSTGCTTTSTSSSLQNRGSFNNVPESGDTGSFLG